MTIERASGANGWVPVAASEDVIPRHVFQGKLLGQELAIWRADDGYVNIWENRCLHRGVRLSIGINTGTELICQYHGWRYANRNAGCTYIPAHPADAPPRTICNRTYPVREAAGLIWTHLDAVEPAFPALTEAPLVLRAMPLRAVPAAVEAALAAWSVEGLTAEGDLRFGDGSSQLQLYVQAVDAGQSVIRGVLTGALAGQGLVVLRRLNTALTALTRQLEAEALAAPAPAPIAPVYARVSEELAEMPGLEADLADGPGKIRVTLAAKKMVANGIVSLELKPLRGVLPTFQPGAHIDVALPSGLVRQYSLVNAPGETDRYVIGVKREAQSTGGSEAIHEHLREGDLLAISEPRNNFTLRRDAAQTIFIAGGIGVTPLLAMSAALAGDGQDFQLHYFAAGQEHLAFQDRLAALGDRLTPHLGLDPAATAAKLRDILAQPGPAKQVYVCGPGPMLDATLKIAAEAGWPDNSVHFEYFKNTQTLDDSQAFEIALARSAVTLQVPAGKSILQVLRENGIKMASSCGQGACGTCKVRVLEGTPDHQDVYLNASEKASNATIMTCVSRAKTDRLILDL
ncbi:Rieske 2Fe-2S domain-containing protein [Xinfangfangia sp. CPCC 101601]|uniref:Rieske 2Fe-2S domain-containing protein n=1 Tax=Pseudogemmobacter lacusdianii TaxID=3069608 RepID=A0ABU0VZ43_9RHOB|nr:Rieske 2Fe-2S domain-containing protein [Xinfangfangia sp. CPCC 101601]MDQ2066992.1 Rieske 2Fe-2S domain-containing protein [Xinfangfangia sp. CPCC 101601]